MRIFLTLAALLIGDRAGAPPSDPAAPERPAAGVDGLPSAPACAVGADGSVFLVWESRSEGREADVLFRRRDPDPDGRWRGDPLRLDTEDSRSLEPRIAVGAAGAVHVAWQDARDGQDDIRVRRSPDGGRSWSPEIRVDGGPPGGAVSSMPALAADRRGRVYLAWEDQRNGDRDIYFARSTDGGESFEPDVRVDADDPGAGVSYHPDVLCRDDGTVLVFWRDERDGLADVYLRRSRDAGRTWEPERRLDAGEPGSTASMHLGVAASGSGEWAAVWEEGGREVVGVRSRFPEDDPPTPVPLAGEGRGSLLPEDELLAAAASRGVIPAAALAGGRMLWAGAGGRRIWSAFPTGTGLRVVEGGGAVHEIPWEREDAAAATRLTGLTGTGLPGGGLFLAWVRESDAGRRLETAMILSGDAR